MDCFHSKKHEEPHHSNQNNGHHNDHYNDHGNKIDHYQNHVHHPQGQTAVIPTQNCHNTNGVDYGMVSPIRPSWANPQWNHQHFNMNNMKIDNPHNLPIKPIQFNPNCKKCRGSGVRTSLITRKNLPCKNCYTDWGYCKSCYGTGTNFKRDKACKKCGQSGLNKKAMKGYTSSSDSSSE